MSSVTYRIFAISVLFAAGLAVGRISVPSVAPTSVGTGGAVPDTVAKSASDGRLFVEILAKNAAVYLALASGLLTAGLTTVAVVVVNGVILGRIIGVARGAGFTAVDVVVGLAPHGVVELMCLGTSAVIGLRGAAIVSDWWRGQPVLIHGWSRTARYLLIGLLGLVVAAAAEVWISIPLARRLL